MKTTSADRETIEKVRLIAGCSPDQCKDFFESLLTYIIQNFLENRDSTIPYLGEIDISYLGDEITSEGKIAKVSIQICPNYNLQKIIGQIADKEETEIHKIFKQKIKNELECSLNEED